MIIGIVGSRAYPVLERVRAYVVKLPLEVSIVSGGAHGVDQTAEQAARSRGMTVYSLLPDWKRDGKGAGLKRNVDIVAKADLIVAFWDGTSMGTLHSIRCAVEAGKKVIIYGCTPEERAAYQQRKRAENHAKWSK